MHDYSGFIVYLWIFPAFLVIILPLMILLIRLLDLMLRYIFSGINNRWIGNGRKEKRATERIYTEQLEGVISGFGESVAVRTCNISSSGICLKGLPSHMFNNAENLQVNVGTAGGDIRLMVEPRWQRAKKGTKNIGAVLLSPPQAWLELVNNWQAARN